MNNVLQNAGYMNERLLKEEQFQTTLCYNVLTIALVVAEVKKKVVARGLLVCPYGVLVQVLPSLKQLFNIIKLCLVSSYILTKDVFINFQKSWL